MRVLFVCIHNSARSQMAEAFLNKFGYGKFIAESAGIEPGNLNPFVVEAMKEIDIDISMNKVKSVFDLLRDGKEYDHIITVCDNQAKEKCPIFPGNACRFHWSFVDPSSFKGSKEAIMQNVRIIRDQIKARIDQFIEEIVY